MLIANVARLPEFLLVLVVRCPLAVLSICLLDLPSGSTFWASLLGLFDLLPQLYHLGLQIDQVLGVEVCEPAKATSCGSSPMSFSSLAYPP